MYMRIVLLTLVLFLGLTCQKGEQLITIETEYGDMVAKLYDATPSHRDNMVKLIKDGFYQDLLFHRVMQNFMIQGGDPESRDAPSEKRLGMGGPGYQVDAEIGALHFKGALSAARQPDQVNPEKKSSGSQFFIVQGYQVPAQELDRWQQQKNMVYSDSDKERYQNIGGYPFLDGDYTVFGEVVEGLDVIDKIAAQPVDGANRPTSDIKMNIRLGR
ncbi:MAG: peptidylprolyl isomerase [Saprospiraceae bacterium]|nr:peptidylprolyl isomerase [Saprospiraceae bacterium]